MAEYAEKRNYCALPPQPVRELSPDIPHDRARAILLGSAKWVNGTVLHYYFFDRDTDGEQVRFSNGQRRFVSWVGAEDQRQVVRDSFAKWKSLPIGLKFEEVDDRNEAEVRIGFMETDGSWSYVGRRGARPARQPAHDELRLGPHDAVRPARPRCTRSGTRSACRTSTRTRSRASSGTRRRSTTTSPATRTSGPRDRRSTTCCASSARPRSPDRPGTRTRSWSTTSRPG